MKRTRRGLIICAVLVAEGFGIWLVVRSSGPYEPVYQGKRLGYWLKLDARAGATYEDHAEAEAAFRALDTNAVPFLVARLERDAIWDARKIEYNSLVDKWHLPAALKLTNTAAFNSSARALTFLHKPATPGLLRVFEETSNTNALNVAAQTLFYCQGLGFGGNFPRHMFNQSQDGPDTWSQFVNEQKYMMSPTAWQRLNNACVDQHRL